MEPAASLVPGRAGLLSPYRVLDLTDEKGYLCGRILADLGADVIKVEPPGGDPGRRLGPFYKDIKEPERSLYWMAYNVNKRSVTLSLESSDGRETFRRLVRGADFVIESFPPGYLNRAGLGYTDLKALNPRVVMVSITPFGQKGPKAGFPASDLTCWASGGAMYIMGDPDRAPLHLGWYNAYLLAGVYASVGAMIAHAYRQVTGVGQHVDASIQESVAACLMDTPEIWDITGVEPPRMGVRMRLSHAPVQQSFAARCKDGWCVAYMLGGTITQSRNMERLVKWMDEAGAAPDWMKKMDWQKDYGSGALNPEKVAAVESAIAAFFINKTKQEVQERAFTHGVFATPICNAREVLANEPLKARGTWEDLTYPGLGTIQHPSRYLRMTRGQMGAYRKAPGIGEHNEEIYRGEIGHAAEKPRRGRQAGSKASPAAKRALEGLKVLDLTWVAAGPVATSLLGDHGATVVKVEWRDRIDSARAYAPFKDGSAEVNKSGWFTHQNSSKLSLSVNLEKPEGRQIILDLAKWADVFVENMSPGSAKKLGISYEDVTGVNPEIIYVSVSLQGQDGPYASMAGFGQMANAAVGFWESAAGLTGEPPRPTGHTRTMSRHHLWRRPS